MHNDAQTHRTKLSPPRLAKRWGVSPTKIVEFIRSGELRAINLATSRAGRPRYLIDEADVEAFERRREVLPTTAGETKRVRRKSPTNVKEFF